MMLIKIYNCEKRFMGRGAKTMGRGGEELFLKVFSSIVPRRIRDERTRHNPDSWQGYILLLTVIFVFKISSTNGKDTQQQNKKIKRETEQKYKHENKGREK